MGQIYTCCSCGKRFKDWNRLETHPCPTAEQLASDEPLRTVSYGLDPNGLDVLEDDYGEESFP